MGGQKIDGNTVVCVMSVKLLVAQYFFVMLDYLGMTVLVDFLNTWKSFSWIQLFFLASQ